MEKMVSVDYLRGIMEQETRNPIRRDHGRTIFRLPTYRGRSVVRALLPLGIPLFIVMVLLFVVMIGQEGENPLDLVSSNLDIPGDTYAQTELNRIVEGSLAEVPQNQNFQRLLDIIIVQNHTVESGETLSSIGSKYNVTPETIASYNGISLYGNLQVGDALNVPSINGRMYTVQSGDSLSVIGQRFGVSLQDVIDANNLASTTIYVGQKLFLPDMYVVE